MAETFNDAAWRRQVLLKELQGRRLEDAYLRGDLRALMEEEADATRPDDPDPLITRDMLQTLDELVKARRERDLALTDRQSAYATRDLTQSRLLSSATAVIVPGFLASQLSDKSTDPPGAGLIWINPLATFFVDRLSSLRLTVPLGGDGGENDVDPRVRIMPDGPLPIAYDLLRASLETSLFSPRYWTHVFAFDWRRNLEDAAAGLALFVRSLKNQAPDWDIHVIAHSQGALVARRALQNLHQNDRSTLGKVKSLVLLGPANFGSMSAVRGMGNEASQVGFVRKFAVEPGAGFNSILSTFSGLYQLIPSRPDLVPWLSSNPVADPSWWGSFPVDATRLNHFYGWAEGIDTSFFDQQTTVILGGDPVNSTTGSTVGGVRIDAPGTMSIDVAFGMVGDGTIPHSCALLPGVRTYQAVGAEHAILATYSQVISAVQSVLQGRTPALPAVVSNNPADYASPRPYQARGLDRRVELGRDGQAMVPRIASGNDLGQLAAALATAAHQTKAKFRITVEVDPIDPG